jgi:hypothetical protein
MLWKYRKQSLHNPKTKRVVCEDKPKIEVYCLNAFEGLPEEPKMMTVLSKLDFDFVNRSSGFAARCAEGLCPSGGQPLDRTCFR